jgi:hypothetical protein
MTDILFVGNPEHENPNLDHRASLKLTVFFLLICIYATNTSQADVSLQDGYCPAEWGGCVRVYGQISEADSEVLSPIFSRAKERDQKVNVSLNSTGGDVRVAIKIGRLMRQVRAVATIGNSSECSSACIFLLIGATERPMGEGIFRIHRPYSQKVGDKSFSAAQNEFDEIEKLVKSYLKEMNVSESFFDAMMSIPPEDSRRLSVTDLMAYGIGYIDPAEQEIQDSASAEKYNLTKQEYLRRKKLAYQICDPILQEGRFSDYWRCDAMIKATGSLTTRELPNSDDADAFWEEAMFGEDGKSFDPSTAVPIDQE